jgi:hypothetical protein
MSAILKLLIHLGTEIINALAKFFTVHFIKSMTVTGIVIGLIFLMIFIGSKK